MDKPLMLLVYPEVPDTYWSYKHALSFVGKKALMPPLGLATIAAMIPDHYEIRIVDLNVERLSDRVLKQASLVLLSAMIVQAKSFARLVKRCNRMGVAVAAGGPFVTSCADTINGLDYRILGEAEEVFPRFISDFDAGRAESTYRAEKRPDLCEVPIPRFDLVKMKLYDALPIQFSRGCPFDCEFCDIVSLFGHRVRTKSAEQFIAELDAAYAMGFRGSLFVVDDNFIGNRRAVKHLLRSLVSWQIAHGRPFSFCTEASIDLAGDDELLDLLTAAGFNMVFVGLETPEPESLVAAGKLQNLRRDVLESVRRIQSRGIEVTGGFIIGFDSDTAEIFDLQIDFIRRLAIPTAMVGLLTALPRTKLYDRLESAGRILHRASGNNTHDGALNFVPRLPARVLVDGYERVLKTIYSPAEYFERCLGVLDRFPAKQETRQLKPRITGREILGLLMSLARQVFSSYGIRYLRYLILAFRRRPDLAVRIITMAIQGHHYFTITQRMVLRSEGEVGVQDIATPAVRGRLTEMPARAVSMEGV